MAIHLFCYNSYAVADAEQILAELTSEKQDIFEYKYLISAPRQASAFDKERVSEFGVDAQSLFLVRLNDKGASGLMRDVVAILKEKFGLQNIVVIFDGHTLM